MLRSSGASLPGFADLVEKFHQQLHRQPALHLELAVDAGLGLFQHIGRQIGGDNVDAVARERRTHTFDRHRQRIRLLPGRGRRAPDADALFARTRGNQGRHNGVAEMIERYLVAEEKGLVGGHRLDHLGAEWRGRPIFQPLDQLVERAHAVAARHRQEPAFGEILLLDRQHETGALAQELAQIVEVLRGHERSPVNRRVSLPAISGNGSTAEHRPALRDLTGHAPDDAGRLVLRHHVAAGRNNRLRRRRVRPSPCR